MQNDARLKDTIGQLGHTPSGLMAALDTMPESKRSAVLKLISDSLKSGSSPD